MKTFNTKKTEPEQLITHPFKPDQMLEAYDAAKEKALK